MDATAAAAVPDTISNNNMNTSDNAKVNRASIIAKVGLSHQTHRGCPRKVHWTTKQLISNFYAHCNTSMKQITTLFGLGIRLMYDIVYVRENVVCVMLAIFPGVDKDLDALGRANSCMLLDTIELCAEVSLIKTAN